MKNSRRCLLSRSSAALRRASRRIGVPAFVLDPTAVFAPCGTGKTKTVYGEFCREYTDTAARIGRKWASGPGAECAWQRYLFAQQACQQRGVRFLPAQVLRRRLRRAGLADVVGDIKISLGPRKAR